MSYRITSYSALQANLSAANTAVMLCRANIGLLPLSSDERVYDPGAWQVRGKQAALFVHQDAPPEGTRATAELYSV